jgi:signal transduction histidine kinase
VPAAAWDATGQLLLATTSWRSLAVGTDAPPAQPELAIGHPPRHFVVESEQHSGTHVVFLREVTRERQALQAKDELLALLGHELRTPLSSIKGYGQLMARQLATVQEQVQRLDALIADVLDSAHAEAGPLPLRREPLSVSDLVRSACDRFAAAQPDRRVDLSVVATAVIEGDADRLSQVLDNILSNAAKYSPPHTPIGVRTFLDADDADRVRIAITDQGAGIAPEHVPRLFDRFYRVPANDASAPSGFGLGLSIVRDLVEAHGGQVQVYSAGPGRGSTFTVVLPIALPLAEAEAESATLASA